MKFSHKTEYITTFISLLIISLIYVLVILIGIKEQNINLKKVDKATNVVEDFGIGIHQGSKGRRSKAFYVKLKDVNEKVGIYRFNKSYIDLLELVNVGDSVTIYYHKRKTKDGFVNIDLIQIEQDGKVLLSKSEYQNKESIFIYVGIGGLICNFFILRNYRKKYLKTIKK